MKQISITFLMLFTLVGFAQNAITSSEVKTNYEEYNYLTERYGLADNATMLEGYEFQDFMELTIEQFNYNYKLFVDTKTGKVKAVFIAITKIKKKQDKVRYLCMPFNNGALFKRFEAETATLGVSMSLGLDALNKAMLAKLLDEKFNGKKHKH
jgi:hypothetical protein